MSDQRFIDDALRGVPVPDDLRSRLRPESLFADAEIDRLLAEVPVPSSLQDTIRTAVHGQPSRFRDGAIDLARFAPRSLVDGTERGVHARPVTRSRSGLASLARDITSVVAALGLVVMLAVAGIEFSRRLEGTPSGARTITRLDFGTPANEIPDEWPLRFHVPEEALRQPDRHVASQAAPPELIPGPADPTPASGSGSPILGGEPVITPQQTNPAIVRGAPISGALPPGLFAPPAMMTADIPGVSRRRVPRVRGYDLPFEMTTGEQPFVDPAAHPALATDRPPLSLRVDSFEALTAGGRAARERIRAEEVLAAVQPPPAQRQGNQPVRLTLHEVKAIRNVGDGRAVLVEVAATAAPIAQPDRLVEATLVLDQSAAGDPAVWRRICRAMGDLATQLAADDRVRVVLCGQRPRVVLHAAGARELSALAADLEWQAAAASTDLDAGLLLAHPAKRIIVVSSANSLDAARGTMLRESLSSWRAALSSVGGDTLLCDPVGGIRFIILDPSAPSASDRGEPAFGRTSPDAVAIRRALIQQVTGRDTLVARQCDLEVRFDPRRVARYRLIGHRQSAVESLAEGAPRGTDLHAGETFRVVYEVILRSPDIVPGLAAAVLSWRNQGGDLQRLEVGPSRSSIDVGGGLPSPHGCELLLAAGLGELAAGSAHVHRRPALVAALDQLIAEWRNRGDISPVGEALARSHEQRSGGGRKGL